MANNIRNPFKCTKTEFGFIELNSLVKLYKILG